ncbi:LOW QUALITY PROTEIN: hypothetical protein Cgig2_006240 [Carnegiea gigantea]|uniref:Uncharacterized protein n=1 Tax=Carnegiea gigantea TaxID=171969 RepID=A0A9Q1GQT9_9CARY|nr:LOW QUALITY PROTEIN: hypothetical protein Cgig2_006240 [Carnegiea gigantea]
MKNMMRHTLRDSRNEKSNRMPQNSLECQSSSWLKKTRIASLDWCQLVLDKLITSVRHYKESTDKASNNSGAPSFDPTLLLHKPNSEDQISGTTLVADTSVTVEKEDYRKDVVLDQPNNVMKKDDSIPSSNLRLGLSQSDSQSPTTSVPDPNTVGVNEDDDNEDDGDGAPLSFPLKNTSQVNHELSTMKSVENMTSLLLKRVSVGEKMTIAPTTKQAVEQKKGSPRADSDQKATDSSRPKLTKEVCQKRMMTSMWVLQELQKIWRKYANQMQWGNDSLKSASSLLLVVCHPANKTRQ